MILAGLTGNFGSGKSLVLALFNELGVLTIDSDQIVGSLLKTADVRKKIRGLFGSGAFTGSGSINRKYIANIVFKNRKIRDKLEAILHPLVFAEIDRYIRRIKGKNCIVIVEVPLLFEKKCQDRFDRIITVYANQKTSVERLRKAGVSRNEALSRLRTQLPVAGKKKLSDYTINNNGSRQQTRCQVNLIYGLLLDMLRENA
jgi:dephospho-CoA kinase